MLFICNLVLRAKRGKPRSRESGKGRAINGMHMRSVTACGLEDSELHEAVER